MVSHAESRVSPDSPDDVLVPIPAALAASIDELVGVADRAAFVREAVRDRIDGERRLHALESLADRLASRPVPPWRTTESAERWVRDLRGEWDGAAGEHGAG